MSISHLPSVVARAALPVLHLIAGSLLAASGATAMAQDMGTGEPGFAAFRCGGIGDLEQKQFKADAAHHDALLTFATAAGAYLADARVRITDARGQAVIDTACDGPLMLVDLPAPGRYHIDAWIDGVHRHTVIEAGTPTARATLTWRVS